MLCHQDNCAVGLILIALIAFITHVDLSEKLSKEIRMGTFSNYLLKPYTFWIAAFMEAFAQKINYLVLVFPLTAVVLVFLVAKGYLFFSSGQLLSAVLIAAFAFLLHFVLDMLIAFWAFWTDNVWAFKHVKIILFGFLGGAGFPLDFLPEHLGAIARFLPFQYFYYVPVTYLLGKNSDMEKIISDGSHMLLWMIVLPFFCFFAWRAGLKRYDAYGS
ncbi:MAG: ABC-2 family transporter protein [Candidatus Sungbacteria bacterium]|nr:ABC-2 family transporter protein [Candidatus Sungbacteria bacterium]